jgi:hypothetical protein
VAPMLPTHKCVRSGYSFFIIFILHDQRKSQTRCTIPVVETRASPVMTDVNINDVDWVIMEGHADDLVGDRL